MSKVDLNALREQLLSRIDTSDMLEVKKVNDLIRLHELDGKCDEVIDRDGVSIIIENGPQKFIKSHPSMNEKMKINAQKIALEKSIKFKIQIAESPAAASSTVGDKFEPGGLI